MDSLLHSKTKQAVACAVPAVNESRKYIPVTLARISRFLRRGGSTPPPVDASAQPVDSDTRPWIGVDLDGTLAFHAGWLGPRHIGAPVPAMLARVRRWLEAGYRVKIMTARASNPACIPPVRAWLVRTGLPHDLEITCTKDFFMIELWDDRAIQVCANRGEPVAGSVSRIPPAPNVEPGFPGNFIMEDTKPRLLSSPPLTPSPVAGDL